MLAARPVASGERHDQHGVETQDETQNDDQHAEQRPEVDSSLHDGILVGRCDTLLGHK
jgi:hypothetical protein